MTTWNAAAGQLASVYASAVAGDTIIVTGLQDFGSTGTFNIDKTLTILNAPGQRATLKAQKIVIWETAQGTIIDGQTTDPRSNGFIIDGSYVNAAASVIIRASSGKLKGFDLFTNYQNIALITDKPGTYPAGGDPSAIGNGFEICYGIIRQAGPLGDNHEQGAYLESNHVWLHDLLIYDNAARGIQIAPRDGTGNMLIEKCTIVDNGEGVLFDGTVNCIVRKCIIAYHQVDGRWLVEQYDSSVASAGNTVSDNYIWDTPTWGSSYPLYNYQGFTPGFTITNPQNPGDAHNVDPVFVGPRVSFGTGGTGNYQLQTGSPARGYGASFLDPSTSSLAPTTSILDNFNRANNSTIGANYTAIFSTAEPLPALSSNAAFHSGGSTASAYWNGFTVTDGEVYADFTGGNVWNLWIRASGYDPNNSPTHGYVLKSDGSGNLSLYKSNGSGGLTQLGSTLTGLTIQKLWLKAVGTAITGYTYDGSVWTQQFSVTDSSHAGPGNIGFEIGGSGGSASGPTTSVLDNFNRSENPLSTGWGAVIFSGDGQLEANGTKGQGVTASVTNSQVYSTSFSGDVEVYADPDAAAADLWLAARISNENSGTLACFICQFLLSGDEINLYEITGGSISGYLINHGSPSSGQPLTAYTTFLMRVTGTTTPTIILWGLRSGTWEQVGNYTYGSAAPTSLQGSGKLGVRIYSQYQFDNFGGGVVSSGGSADNLGGGSLAASHTYTQRPLLGVG